MQKYLFFTNHKGCIVKYLCARFAFLLHAAPVLRFVFHKKILQTSQKGLCKEYM